MGGGEAFVRFRLIYISEFGPYGGGGGLGMTEERCHKAQRGAAYDKYF